MAHRSRRWMQIHRTGPRSLSSGRSMLDPRSSMLVAAVDTVTLAAAATVTAAVTDRANSDPCAHRARSPRLRAPRRLSRILTPHFALAEFDLVQTRRGAGRRGPAVPCSTSPVAAVRRTLGGRPLPRKVDLEVSPPVARIEPRAVAVRATDDELLVDLADGRRLAVPLVWFPKLLHASPAQRSHFDLIGDGEGIHWPDVDEDISVRGLPIGLPSVEYTGGAAERA